MPTVRSESTRRIPGPKQRKSKEVLATRSAGACDYTTRVKTSKCLEIGKASEKVERMNEFSQLEGLNVLPLQDSEKIEVDK